jgi:hypothetical protein
MSSQLGHGPLVGCKSLMKQDVANEVQQVTAISEFKTLHHEF